MKSWNLFSIPANFWFSCVPFGAGVGHWIIQNISLFLSLGLFWINLRGFCENSDECLGEHLQSSKALTFLLVWGFNKTAFPKLPWGLWQEQFYSPNTSDPTNNELFPLRTFCPLRSCWNLEFFFFLLNASLWASSSFCFIFFLTPNIDNFCL